jgi:hypothetical protein
VVGHPVVEAGERAEGEQVVQAAAELHQYAGPPAALTVVSGSLTEQGWAGDRLRSRRLVAERSAGFRAPTCTTSATRHRCPR